VTIPSKPNRKVPRQKKLDSTTEVHDLVVEQPEEATPTERPKKVLTKRQQLQADRDAARDAASQPVMRTHSAITKRGAPKTVHRQPRYDDPQIVQDGLEALLQDDPELKATFCDASREEAERLLRTNKSAEQLAEELREVVALPTRVPNYLKTVVRQLHPQYVEEHLMTAQEAREAAEERRAAKIAEARAAAARRELALKRKDKARYIREGSWRQAS